MQGEINFGIEREAACPDRRARDSFFTTAHALDPYFITCCLVELLNLLSSQHRERMILLL